MEKTEQLKALYTSNNLEKEDVFILELGGKKIPIIKREGIEKIQANNNIRVVFDVIKISNDLKYCVVKAIGEMPKDNGSHIKIETYGEAKPDNCKSSYIVSMAEKRALSRVVLKLAGFYSLGVYSEDEADDFKQK